MKSKARKHLSLLSRLVVGLGLLFYILKRINPDELRSVCLACSERRHGLIAAGVLAGLILLVGAMRWRLILAARGISFSLKNLFRVYIIGHFFNSFMPGMAGGDLVRAFYTTRLARCCQTEAVGAVLVDRISGMLVVYSFTLGVMLLNYKAFVREVSLRLPGGLMLAIILGGFLLLLWVYNFRRCKHWPLIKLLWQHPRVARVITILLDVFDVLRLRPKLIRQTFFLSLLAQILLLIEFSVLGYSLNISLRFIDYLLVVPIVMSLAAVPITPGGLGTREAFAVIMFGALGVTAAESISMSLLYYAVSLSWSMVGGIVFLTCGNGSNSAPRLTPSQFREEVAGVMEEFRISGSQDQ